MKGGVSSRGSLEARMMKSIHTWAILLTAVLLTSSAASLSAEDWKTTDGKVYQNVTVVDSSSDAVTILHRDGGALVPLANLPPDIQKRFHYDPDKAKAAADARRKDDDADALALQAEMDQASKMRQAGPEAQDPDAPKANSSLAADGQTAFSAPASGDAGHHSIDELVASAHSLKSDPSDSSHHSIDELTAATLTLRRDLSDPTYHTTAHLTYMINSQGLGPDLSDPTHHSMNEISDSGL
jgi:hypothetical protein